MSPLLDVVGVEDDMYSSSRSCPVQYTERLWKTEDMAAGHIAGL